MAMYITVREETDDGPHWYMFGLFIRSCNLLA